MCAYVEIREIILWETAFSFTESRSSFLAASTGLEEHLKRSISAPDSSDTYSNPLRVVRPGIPIFNPLEPYQIRY